jgi:hypothetical protein
MTSTPGLSFLLAGSTAVWLWKRRRRIAPPRRERPPYPDLLRELTRSEGLARRWGWERQARETLSAFARRLREGQGRPEARLSELADWYEEYVRVRYGGAEGGSQAAPLAARLRHIAGRRRGG